MGAENLKDRYSKGCFTDLGAVWKQVFFAFTNNWKAGNNSINFFWERVSWGTGWLREDRDLLRLLTILETMTNYNKIGSNVDLLCEHH